MPSWNRMQLSIKKKFNKILDVFQSLPQHGRKSTNENYYFPGKCRLFIKVHSRKLKLFPSLFVIKNQSYYDYCKLKLFYILFEDWKLKLFYIISNYWKLKLLYNLSDYWKLKLFYILSDYWKVKLFYVLSGYWKLKLFYIPLWLLKIKIK